MSEATRLWVLVCDEHRSGEPSHAELLSAVPLAAVVSSGSRSAERAAHAIAAPRGMTFARDERLNLCESSRPGASEAALAALDAWTRPHTGAQVAVFACGALGRLALCRLLDLAPGAGQRFALDSRAALALDWPATGARAARSALAGFALDWCPPWTPTIAPRFPGGPGSAAPGRP